MMPMLDWTADAARRTLELCQLEGAGFAPVRHPAGLGGDHATWLLLEVAEGRVSGTKAHRWLGYAQGVFVETGFATLEEMKLANKDASDAAAVADVPAEPASVPSWTVCPDCLGESVHAPANQPGCQACENQGGWTATDEAPAPEIPLITFGQAEVVGRALHDRWEKMTGRAPLDVEDMAWADLVQFVLRTAKNITDDAKARGGE